ncbi:MAG: helix-turn-helix transcriptional regulator [Leptospiraceae bacterium]|nr:helix-turn-helix transcriptional regulator [Leptospiraceae bacterium]
MEHDIEDLKKQLRSPQQRNELFNLFMNVGDIIKTYRQKRNIKLHDLSSKIQQKHGEIIHPTILSRYENKKLEIKNTHLAYIFDVLEIYLDDLFPEKIVLVNLKEYVTNIKFQYLVSELRSFFTDDEIRNFIIKHLEMILHCSWRAIDIYSKSKDFKEVSEE